MESVYTAHLVDTLVKYSNCTEEAAQQALKNNFNDVTGALADLCVDAHEQMAGNSQRGTLIVRILRVRSLNVAGHYLIKLKGANIASTRTEFVLVAKKQAVFDQFFEFEDVTSNDSMNVTLIKKAIFGEKRIGTETVELESVFNVGHMAKTLDIPAGGGDAKIAIHLFTFPRGNSGVAKAKMDKTPSEKPLSNDKSDLAAINNGLPPISYDGVEAELDFVMPGGNVDAIEDKAIEPNQSPMPELRCLPPVPPSSPPSDPVLTKASIHKKPFKSAAEAFADEEKINSRPFIEVDNNCHSPHSPKAIMNVVPGAQSPHQKPAMRPMPPQAGFEAAPSPVITKQSSRNNIASTTTSQVKPQTPTATPNSSVKQPSSPNQIPQTNKSTLPLPKSAQKYLPYQDSPSADQKMQQKQVQPLPAVKSKGREEDSNYTAYSTDSSCTSAYSVSTVDSNVSSIASNTKRHAENKNLYPFSHGEHAQASQPKTGHANAQHGSGTRSQVPNAQQPHPKKAHPQQPNNQMSTSQRIKSHFVNGRPDNEKAAFSAKALGPVGPHAKVAAPASPVKSHKLKTVENSSLISVASEYTALPSPQMNNAAPGGGTHIYNLQNNESIGKRYGIHTKEAQTDATYKFCKDRDSNLIGITNLKSASGENKANIANGTKPSAHASSTMERYMTQQLVSSGMYDPYASAIPTNIKNPSIPTDGASLGAFRKSANVINVPSNCSTGILNPHGNASCSLDHNNTKKSATMDLSRFSNLDDPYSFKGRKQHGGVAQEDGNMDFFKMGSPTSNMQYNQIPNVSQQPPMPINQSKLNYNDNPKGATSGVDLGNKFGGNYSAGLNAAAGKGNKNIVESQSSDAMADLGIFSPNLYKMKQANEKSVSPKVSMTPMNGSGTRVAMLSPPQCTNSSSSNSSDNSPSIMNASPRVNIPAAMPNPLKNSSNLGGPMQYQPNMVYSPLANAACDMAAPQMPHNAFYNQHMVCAENRIHSPPANCNYGNKYDSSESSDSDNSMTTDATSVSTVNQSNSSMYINEGRQNYCQPDCVPYLNEAGVPMQRPPGSQMYVPPGSHMQASSSSHMLSPPGSHMQASSSPHILSSPGSQMNAAPDSDLLSSLSQQNAAHPTQLEQIGQQRIELKQNNQFSQLGTRPATPDVIELVPEMVAPISDNPIPVPTALNMNVPTSEQAWNKLDSACASAQPPPQPTDCLSGTADDEIDVVGSDYAAHVNQAYGGGNFNYNGTTDEQDAGSIYSALPQPVQLPVNLTVDNLQEYAKKLGKQGPKTSISKSASPACVMQDLIDLRADMDAKQLAGQTKLSALQAPNIVQATFGPAKARNDFSSYNFSKIGWNSKGF